MRSRKLKILKITGISILVSVLSFIILLFLLSYLWNDKIKEAIASGLNNQFEEDVQVKNMDFSILRSFPFASVELSEVKMESAKSFRSDEFSTPTDTLVRAKKVFLEFHLLNLLKGKYLVERIHINDGKVKLGFDSKGVSNLDFLMGSDSSGGNIHIDLRKVTLENIEIYYEDKTQQILFHAHIHESQFSGNFSADSYHLRTNSIMWIGKMYSGNEEIISRRPVKLQIDFDVNQNEYQIKKGLIVTAGMKFSASGTYDSNNNYLDFNISGNDLNIQSFLSILPQDVQDETKDFKSSGRFYLDTKIKGKLSETENPVIDIQFGIQNGRIESKSRKLTLNAIDCIGEFSNGNQQSLESSFIHISSFTFRIKDDSYFKGSLSLTNLNSNNLEITSDFKLNTKELDSYLNQLEIENVYGIIYGQIKVKGKPSQLKLGGNVQLEKIAFSESVSNIRELSGQILFDETNIYTENLHFNINGSEVAFKGSASNWESYFKDNGSLKISGMLTTPAVDFNSFMADEEEEADTSALFPEDIQLNIGFQLGEFLYDKLKLREISGSLDLAGNELGVKNLKTKTLNGSISGNIRMKELPDHQLFLEINSSLKDIDVHELFYSLNNFDQDFLTDDHLMGDLNGEVMLKSQLSPDFEILTPTLYMESDFTIRKGELFDFEPLDELSRFIDVSEIDHLRFSELTNTIVLQEEKLFMPQMEIKSNLLSLKFSGIHDLNDQFEYKLEVLLSELLSKKARLANRNNSDYDPFDEESGRSTLFLKIEGNEDDFNISYDRDALKARRKRNMKRSNQDLKRVLFEEWGLFKKDSTELRELKNKQEDRKKSKVKIVWDDEDEIINEDDDQ